MSDLKKIPSNDADPELEDLLDSALQEMTKKTEKPEKPEEPEGVEVAQPPNMWSEEFIKEAAAQFESNMAAILGGFSGVPEDQISQDQIAQTFAKMAEAAAKVLKPGETPTGEPPSTVVDPDVQNKIDEVSAAISQTLQNLNTNVESLQTPPFSDEDLANMFNNFNMDSSAEGQENNMFVPFMQGMMQSLLSKEVLYPSLKELVDKYPTWLKDNKDKIDTAEYKRFEKQHLVMQQVCAELEPESEDDTEDVKRARFTTVLDLMQKMQELGQPPTELVGDIVPPPQGFIAPNDQDTVAQCALM